MNHRNAKLIVAGVIALLAVANAFGCQLVSPEHLALGGLLLVGDMELADRAKFFEKDLSANTMQLFKDVPWRAGVDPRAAVAMIKASLFKVMLDPQNKPLYEEARDGFQKLRTEPNVLSQEVLAKLGFTKAFVQPGSATSGLAQYDLEQGARLLYPVTTIFRNLIARMTGGAGIQSNWRSLTAINPNNLNIGLSEGHRGGFMQQTVIDKTAAFRTSGIDNYVTEQAYLAAVTFEDLLALAVTTTLQGTMEGEEQLIIGGNSSLALGTGNTPTGTGNTSGGKLGDLTTYSVIVVPLTYLGMRYSIAPSVSASGVITGGAVQLPYTRTNADGTTDLINGFSGIQSSASSAVTISGGGGAGSITTSCTPPNGAIGYAWFLGATPGTEKIVAITGYPTATLTNINSSGGQAATALPATDTSTNALNFDGLLTQILAPGSGAYVKDLGGQPLTTSGSGSGGITEFDNMIADRIQNYRLVPTDIFMSPYDQNKLRSLILTGNTNLAPFFMGDSSDNGLAAAVQAKVYNNPVGFSTPRLEIHAHPFIPPGTIIFYSRANPYPLSNVPQLVRMLCRRDYWQVDWPVVTLQRTLGVYFDAVLQMYFPPAFGVLTGVNN